MEHGKNTCNECGRLMRGRDICERCLRRQMEVGVSRVRFEYLEALVRMGHRVPVCDVEGLRRHHRKAFELVLDAWVRGREESWRVRHCEQQTTVVRLVRAYGFWGLYGPGLATVGPGDQFCRLTGRVMGKAKVYNEVVGA